MPDRTIVPFIKDAKDFDIRLAPYHAYSLRNGVPLYYINDGTEDVTIIEFVFRAGNNYEQKNHVAAVANYLLKNGTSSKSAFEINKFFEYHGAELSCTSQSENASVTLHCLSRHLGVLLPVVREIITDAAYPQNELEIFQQNSIQRLAVNLQKCDFVANRLIDQYLFGKDHPYGRVYSKEDISALRREDLLQHFKEYYVNGQCLIFAAGRLSADFENQIETCFGDLNMGEKTFPLTFDLQPATEKKYRVTNDATGVQGAIRMARQFPNRRHPDFKKASVLNMLFGGFFGSRLMTNIREEKGYTYGIGSYFQNHKEVSAWMISTEAGKDVCEATIGEVYKEMELLCQAPAEEEELLLVKNYIMGLNLGYIDGPFNVMNRWRSLILNGLDEDYFNDTIHQIKTVTSKELQELANKYLKPEEFFELVVI